jgi:hypothetical protein
MKDFFESVSSILSVCFAFLFWGVIIYGAVYFWDSNWLLNLSKPTDKTEKWISLDREPGGYYTSGLNKNWAAFTKGWLTVKGKMRKPLHVYGNDTSYDFVCKVKAKLTQPKLRADLENKIVKSYEFDFIFHFFDEDGFLIYTFTTTEKYHSIKHEKYKNDIQWTPKDYPYDEIEETSEALYQYIIPERIAKRVYKISYVPTLKAIIQDKEEYEKRVEDPFAKVRILEHDELETIKE